MQANEYQELALRTANIKDEESKYYRLPNWALGLAGEAGEVADEIKKIVYHKHMFESKKVGSEIGDILWYCAVLAYEMNYSLEEIMQMNIEKLKARYPAGFSEEKSRNRNG